MNKLLKPLVTLLILLILGSTYYFIFYKPYLLAYQVMSNISGGKYNLASPLSMEYDLITRRFARDVQFKNGNNPYDINLQMKFIFDMLPKSVIDYDLIDSHRFKYDTKNYADLSEHSYQLLRSVNKNKTYRQYFEDYKSMYSRFPGAEYHDGYKFISYHSDPLPITNFSFKVFTTMEVINVTLMFIEESYLDWRLANIFIQNI